MKIEFDPEKNAKNIRERGLPFTLAGEFDWTTAMIAPSSRCGEIRFLAIGYIGSRLHSLVFTKSGNTVRIISLRRAHKTEVKRFEYESDKEQKA
jgi:uncharacterized DUF497 family protein